MVLVAQLGGYLMAHPFSNVTPKHYIWVSTSGSDDNSGSQNSPVETIAQALSMAEPGTAIMVKAGTYNENVSIGKSGTAGAPSR